MGRSPCCDKNGLKKGPWTVEEDQTLIDYIQKHGQGRWRTLPKNAGLKRCGKSCRLRWTNYLRPDIKRGKFTPEEEETIIQLHSLLGNKWSAIATNLPGRTDNEIKNYWNTSIKKKLLRMGIDPATHIPRLDLLELSSILSSNLLNQSQSLNLQNLLGFGTSALSPDLLNLASSLLSSNFQAQNQFPSIQTNPQNLVQIPTTSSVPTECPNFVNQYFQPNLDQVSGIPNWSQSQVNQLGNREGLFGSSFFSTPSCSTTPMNSSSTNYVNGGSTEDERDTYCSDLLLFDIPNGLNNASNGCL